MLGMIELFDIRSVLGDLMAVLDASQQSIG
jgi:hypothetical protein